eukprot:2914733-Pyramimonas_sp.AAC.1
MCSRISAARADGTSPCASENSSSSRRRRTSPADAVLAVTDGGGNTRSVNSRSAGMGYPRCRYTFVMASHAQNSRGKLY